MGDREAAMANRLGYIPWGLGKLVREAEGLGAVCVRSSEAGPDGWHVIMSTPWFRLYAPSLDVVAACDRVTRRLMSRLAWLEYDRDRVVDQEEGRQ
jgi:hypothetical protein